MSSGALHITEHSGKLADIPSLNTNPLTNPFCIKASKVAGSVCSICYARRLAYVRPSLADALQRNSDLLGTRPLAAPMPRFNAHYVRLHSFGELLNAEHAANFADICAANPQTRFALWTKRPDLALSVAWPSNVSLVHSVSALDSLDVRATTGFTHTFAVHSSGAPCGEACLDCLLCWQDREPRIVHQRRH